MNIKEFFENSCGKWFSQRTSQHLAFNQSEWGKSDLWVELLLPSDASVTQLCDQHSIPIEQAICGARITWEGFVGQDPDKQKGVTLLVPIADSVEPNQGTLLRQTISPQPMIATSCYVIGDDDVLTIITDYTDIGATSEERVWFASPNLRLRTSLLKRLNSFSTASFCSEIRLGDANSKPPAASAQTQRRWG
jgi:hypothetical protein